MSYGDADPFGSGCVNALRTFQDAFNYTGAKIVGMVYGSAYGAGEIRANEALLKSIAQSTGGRFNPTARQLFETGGHYIDSSVRLWPGLLAKNSSPARAFT